MLRACEQHHPAAGSNGLHGLRDECVRTDRDQRHVRAAALGGCLGGGNHIPACVDGVLKAEAGGDGVTFRVQIAGQDGCSRARGQRSKQDADASLPDDQHGIVRFSASRRTAL